VAGGCGSGWSAWLQPRVLAPCRGVGACSGATRACRWRCRPVTSGDGQAGRCYRGISRACGTRSMRSWPRISSSLGDWDNERLRMLWVRMVEIRSPKTDTLRSTRTGWSGAGARSVITIMVNATVDFPAGASPGQPKWSLHVAISEAHWPHSNATYRPPGKEDVSEPFLLAGESLASNHEHLEDFLTVLDVESPLKYHCSSSPRQASPCFVSSNSPSQRPNPSFLSWPTVVSAIAQNASAHVQPVSVARNAITLNMQIDTFHQSYTQWP
jgi:hypothetical protein